MLAISMKTMSVEDIYARCSGVSEGFENDVHNILQLQFVRMVFGPARICRKI